MKPFSAKLLEFLRSHIQTPTSQLALQSFNFPELSKQEILQQLTGMQKVVKKFPFLGDYPQYKFPVRLSLEQASSEQTARFKGRLIQGESFADLTGGMGIDTFFLGQSCKEVHYVEINEQLIDLARWNFPILGFNQVEFHQKKAAEFLNGSRQKLDWIYVDPSRRSDNARVIAMDNYQPDIIELWPVIRSKAKSVLIKFSPMQDLMEIGRRLDGLKKIWVLSLKNELKEILAEFGETRSAEVALEIVNISKEESTILWTGKLGERPEETLLGFPEAYVYEPAPGILKAGVQDIVAQKFGLKKLQANSNFFTADKKIENYPGRVFQYKGLEKFQKKGLEKWIPAGKAHVIVRNFPHGAEAIKKKLGLKEAGSTYLLATTLRDNRKMILIAERVD